MVNLNSLYGQYFGRELDESGQNYWQSQLDNGMTEAQVRSALVASPEYQQRAAGQTSPFIYGDHDNNAATAPALINNSNSNFAFDYQPDGSVNVSSTGTGNAFNPFTVGGGNGGLGGLGGQQNQFDPNAFRTEMAGMFKNMFGDFKNQFQNQQGGNFGYDNLNTWGSMAYNGAGAANNGFAAGQASNVSPVYNPNPSGGQPRNGWGGPLGNNNPWSPTF